MSCFILYLSCLWGLHFFFNEDPALESHMYTAMQLISCMHVLTSSTDRWCSWCSAPTSSSVSDVREAWVIDLRRGSRALFDLNAPFSTKDISSGSRSSRLTLKMRQNQH